MRKTIKRREFLRASALTGVALVAAGCAPAAQPSVPPKPAETPAAPVAADTPAAGADAQPTAGTSSATPVTLQFWSHGHTDWVKAQIEAYKAAKPNVQIDFSYGGEQMNEKLLTAIAAGTPPDGFIHDRFRVTPWAVRGGLAPIDDYVKQTGVSAEDYWPGAWNEVVWDNHVYGIPVDADGRFIYWNKDVFKDAGLDPEVAPPTHNWEEMIAMATKLTKKDAQGATTVLGFIPQWFPNLPNNGGDYVVPWANGGEFMKDIKTASMNDPKLVEAMQWNADVNNAVGGINTTSTFASGLPSTEGYSAFGEGKMAMFIGGDWELAKFAKYYPNLKFGMEPWKVRNDPSKVTGFIGGHCLAVPTGAKQVPDTYDWYQFLSRKDSQVDMGVKLQLIPTLKTAALSDELIQNSPYPELRKAANESMEYAKGRPVSPVAELIQDLWNTTGRDAVFYGQKTAQQSCDDMQAEVQKALDEFWKKAG